MTAEIRIGIVGAGANTVGRHLPGLQAIAGCRLVSVCNRSRESSARVAAQWGLPTIYERWQDLVAAPDTDAIVIGTWPYLHAPATIAALAAGKHVLCEARMAATLSEAKAMRDAARARPDLVAQIVPSPMTLRVDRTIRRLLAEGYVGELLALRVRDGNGFLHRDAPLHWRQDTERSGINILSLGIWYEAVLRWVGEATRVSAMGKTFVPMRRAEDGFLKPARVPEHLDVVAAMACGAQAHFSVSAITGLAGPAEAWIFGSDGTLRFTEDRLFGGRKGDTDLAEIPIPESEAGGWQVEEEFVRALRGQETITHTDFDTGVKYMAFTDAVARSLMDGKAVPVAV